MAFSRNSISPQQRRRRVDIYFVLYICVLVLFTIEQKNEITQGSGLQERLTVTAGPRRLQFIVEVSPSGKERTKFLNNDSIIRIQADGNIRNISFRFSLDGREQPIGTDTNALNDIRGSFGMVATPRNNQAQIRWKPPIPRDLKGGAFKARIYVDAMPADTNSRVRYTEFIDVTFEVKIERILTEFDSQLSVQQNTLGTDSLSSLSPGFPQGSSPNDIQRNAGQFFTSDTLYVNPEQPSVYVPSGGRWENTIKVFGGIPKQATITFSDGGANYYPATSIRDNSTINVSGVAPVEGSVKVIVDVQSLNGKSSSKTSFDVRSFKIAPPTFAANVYPGIEESIDPQLPKIPNAEARLLNGDGREIDRKNGELRYIPDDNDIGKTLTLERYIIMPDGSRRDIRTEGRIKVVAPAPDIANAESTSTGGYKLFVRCYGMVKRNGIFVENVINIPSISIEGENAKPVEKSGENRFIGKSIRADRYYSTHVIAIEKNDPKKPMTIRRVILTDRRGKSVEWRP